MGLFPSFVIWWIENISLNQCKFLHCWTDIFILFNLTERKTKPILCLSRKLQMQNPMHLKQIKLILNTHTHTVILVHLFVFYCYLKVWQVNKKGSTKQGMSTSFFALPTQNNRKQTRNHRKKMFIIILMNVCSLFSLSQSSAATVCSEHFKKNILFTFHSNCVLFLLIKQRKGMILMDFFMTFEARWGLQIRETEIIYLYACIMCIFSKF